MGFYIPGAAAIFSIFTHISPAPASGHALRITSTVSVQLWTMKYQYIIQYHAIGQRGKLTKRTVFLWTPFSFVWGFHTLGWDHGGVITSADQNVKHFGGFRPCRTCARWGWNYGSGVMAAIGAVQVPPGHGLWHWNTVHVLYTQL